MFTSGHHGVWLQSLARSIDQGQPNHCQCQNLLGTSAGMRVYISSAEDYNTAYVKNTSRELVGLLLLSGGSLETTSPSSGSRLPSWLPLDLRKLCLALVTLLLWEGMDSRNTTLKHVRLLQCRQHTMHTPI